MHEMAITQDLVELVLARTNGAKVKRVVLEVGMLAAVLPEALRFCFDVCTEDTPMAGASLEILEEPGQARCRSCGGELALSQPLGLCPCGSVELDWLSGEQLRVREVEVA